MGMTKKQTITSELYSLLKDRLGLSEYCIDFTLNVDMSSATVTETRVLTNEVQTDGEFRLETKETQL